MVPALLHASHFGVFEPRNESIRFEDVLRKKHTGKKKPRFLFNDRRTLRREGRHTQDSSFWGTRERPFYRNTANIYIGAFHFHTHVARKAVVIASHDALIWQKRGYRLSARMHAPKNIGSDRAFHFVPFRYSWTRRS